MVKFRLMDDRIIKHIGNGKFTIEIDGRTVECGPNLCGIIRYTYFEDFTIPELDWSVVHKKLTEDYFKKIMEAVDNGDIPKEGGYF